MRLSDERAGAAPPGVGALRAAVLRRPAALPLLVALVLLLPGLVQFDDLDTGGQSQQGLYVVDVLVNGNVLVPSEESGALTSKPPLYTWAAALLSLPAGRVTSFTLKLPAALAGLATVWATARLGVLAGGPLLGVLGGLVLATGFHFLRLATVARPDPFLALFVALAFLEFARGASGDEPKKRFLRAWIWLGLSSLSKGPVGVGVFLAGVLPYLAFRRDRETFRELRLFRGLAIVLAMTLAWFVPAAIRGGEAYVDRLLFFEMIDRAAGIGTGSARRFPFYMYVPYLASRFLPYFLLAPAAIHALASRRGDAPRALGVLAAWFAGGFVLFSLFEGKRPNYLMPLYPAAAVLVALPFAAAAPSLFARRTLLAVSGALVAVAALALAALPFLGAIREAVGPKIEDSYRLAVELRLPSAALAVSAGSLAAVAFVLARRGRIAAAFASFAAATGAAIFVFSVFGVPAMVDAETDSHALASAVRGFERPGDTLLFFGANKSSIHFYLHRHDAPASAERVREALAAAAAGQGGRVLVLVGEKKLAEFESLFPECVSLHASEGRRGFPRHVLFAAP